MQATLERVIRGAAALAAHTLKIFPGRLGSADADTAVRERSVQRLRELAGRLAESGMQLTMETHQNTLCDTVESTQQLLGELGDLPNVGLCFQPYGDQDTDAAMAMFDQLLPAIRHLHLQNRRSTNRACTLLAEGDWTDYRRLLPHVRASGFSGLVCLEFTAGLFAPEGQPFDPAVVLANASQDHVFFSRAWDTPSVDIGT
jgi:3-dehydroshikimate dehydratase